MPFLWVCPQWKVWPPNGQKHLSLEKINSTFLVKINLEGGIFLSPQDNKYPYMQFYYFLLELNAFRNSTKIKYSQYMLTTHSSDAKNLPNVQNVNQDTQIT